MIAGIDYPLDVHFAECVIPVIQPPARYRVLEGGRGSVKSWTFAQKAIAEAAFSNLQFLCCREVQTSIKDSVHNLLVKQINRLNLAPLFDITDNEIRGIYGSRFIFKGLRHNLDEIKSTEGIDRCWVEEAEKCSGESWEVLDPTIRQPNSEIWISFNPKDEKSATFQRFVVKKPPECLHAHLTYRENPWFPEVLRRQMEYCKINDYEKYLWIWEGQPQKYGQAVIFKNKLRVEEFDTPEDAIFYFGADWGYGPDPTCLVRCFIKDRTLYIDHSLYGYGLEIDDLPAHFSTVPGSQDYTIRGDSHRPDTISYLSRNGFNCVGAVKGPDSVKDGIEFLKNFDAIIIHPRNKGVIDDFENYRWKEDHRTEEILAVPVDKKNHGCDATRYAIEPLMRGGMTIFEALVGN